MEFLSEDIIKKTNTRKSLNCIQQFYDKIFLMNLIILIKDVANLEYMVVIVILHVPRTVETTHVTYKMGTVIHVNLDGLE